MCQGNSRSGAFDNNDKHFGNFRGEKLSVDPSQNDYGFHLAAPYCVIANHELTVFTPLEWKDVKNRLNPAAFTTHTIGKRLEKKGDLFKKVLDRKIAISNGPILKAFT